ncbi:hypothetical protein [Lonepinella koalarum]|uniref:hypothetical protein n=1 Tax=Lonepinella koalarum TaxID=53417 RepID=UPI003F6DB355
MAFVTCTQFENSQTEQDEKTETLINQLVTANSAKDKAQDEEIAALKNKDTQHDNQISALQQKDTDQDNYLADVLAGNSETKISLGTDKAGNTITQGDCLVTCNTIGKGIKWNESTQQYEVAVAENQPIHVNDNNELEIRVSALEDNQLRILNGELYQGLQARPELENLHVDAVNGVDQNPFDVPGAGTREKPLKTIRYAVLLKENYTNSNIYLHDSQDHIIDTEFNASIGDINFLNYGEVFDEVSSRYFNWHSQLLELKRLGKRARIVFKGVRVLPYKEDDGSISNKFQVNMLNIPANSTVNFIGIDIHNDIDFYAESDNLHVNDSFVAYHRITLGQNSTLYFRCAEFTSSGVPKISNTDNENLKAQTKLTDGGYPYFGLVNMTDGNLLLEIEDDLSGLHSSIIGNAGWNFHIRTGSNVYLYTSTQNLDTLSYAVTKKIQQKQIEIQPSGDKLLILPSSNIANKYW